MAGDTNEKQIMQLVSRIVETLSADGKNYDTLINVLSLLCLITILNRGSSQSTQAMTPATGSPIQKILGELTKGDGNSGSGPSPDMLLSLLPLLNSPQLKSKLTPSNIATIMGLVNSLGGNAGDKETAKSEKSSSKAESQQSEPPAAAITTSNETNRERTITEAGDEDKKGLGRYLNWKTNF